MTPFFDYARKVIGDPANYKTFITNFTSFYDWYSFIFQISSSQVGTSVELISRLLSREMAKEHPDKVAEVTLGVTNWRRFQALSPEVLFRAATQTLPVLNPAWRESLGLFYSGIGWPEGTTTKRINVLRQGAAADLELLDKISPDSATYFNEARLYEEGS
ncbi:hypothetical protein APHAL10511_004038 [Amanita phalloides]|nr:hypothetical protein APHAL10511_004038 [Amanita phalloides]